MIRKELKSYRKFFTLDFAQRLHIFRFKNYKNDRCESEICHDYINIKNYFSNFNSLTNKIIFKLIINASRVKIEIVKFTTFSLLFRDRLAKTDFFIKS